MIRKLKILIAHKIRDMARETDPRVREGMRGRLVELQRALVIAQQIAADKRAAA